MNQDTGKGWTHPGRRSSDYGKTDYHNHDKRNYASIENFGKGPKRDDQRIHDEICEALYSNSYIDASEFEVNVSDGIVFLEGSISSRNEKKLAEEVCENVRGVKDIFNSLTITNP